MRAVRPALAVFIAAAAFAACASCRVPFTPSPVRFHHVEFSQAAESDEAAAGSVRLDRENYGANDTLTASVALPAEGLGREARFRARVVRVEPGAAGAARETGLDELRLQDVRNTLIELHITLRDAPAGRYALEVELTGAEGAAPVTSRREFSVEPGPASP